MADTLPSLDPNQNLARKQRSNGKSKAKKWKKLQSLDSNDKATAEELQKKLRANQELAAAADEIFNKHDLNQAEELTRLEFISCLDHMGLRELFPGDHFMKKVNECMTKFDKDHNGTIDRNEFLIFYNWLMLDRKKDKDKKRSKEKKHHRHKKDKKRRKKTADVEEDPVKSESNGQAAAEAKGSDPTPSRIPSVDTESAAARAKVIAAANDKAAIKQHVKSALKAVREVLATDKGQQILKIETQVRCAQEARDFIDVAIHRAGPAAPLGLSFVIPPRIMAIGWASGQFVVVSGGAKLDEHDLQIGDVVVGCDSYPVSTIQDLQAASKGKLEMTFRCIRMPIIGADDLKATQKQIEKSLKSAVKKKVKEQLFVARSPKAQDARSRHASAKAKRVPDGTEV